MQAGATILLIEDSSDDTFLFQMALRANGLAYDVKTVENGSEARDYLLAQGRFADREEFPFPKFIIADNCTGKFNGLEFLRWLRGHPDCRVIPFVMLSGSRLPKHVEQAYECGAHSYFEKPTDLASLEALVKLIFEYWSRAVIPQGKQAECETAGAEDR